MKKKILQHQFFFPISCSLRITYQPHFVWQCNYQESQTHHSRSIIAVNKAGLSHRQITICIHSVKTYKSDSTSATSTLEIQRPWTEVRLEQEHLSSPEASHAHTKLSTPVVLKRDWWSSPPSLPDINESNLSESIAARGRGDNRAAVEVTSSQMDTKLLSSSWPTAQYGAKQNHDTVVTQERSPGIEKLMLLFCVLQALALVWIHRSYSELSGTRSSRTAKGNEMYWGCFTLQSCFKHQQVLKLPPADVCVHARVCARVWKFLLCLA